MPIIKRQKSKQPARKRQGVAPGGKAKPTGRNRRLLKKSSITPKAGKKDVLVRNASGVPLTRKIVHDALESLEGHRFYMSISAKEAEQVIQKLKRMGFKGVTEEHVDKLIWA